MNAGWSGMWIVAAAALVGTVANVRRRRWCFGVWVVTNLCWAAYDVEIGAVAQAMLMLVYAGLSVWGLAAWKGEVQE